MATITAAMDPITLAAAHTDLFIDGLSIQDGTPVNIAFSFIVNTTNVDFSGIDFTTTNNSIEMNSGDNSIDNCSFATTGGGQNSVWIKGGNGTSVTNCTFTASQQHAVSIENGGGHTVDNCTATGINDVAFIARGTGGNTFSNCSASNGNHNGFGLLSKDNTIEDCQSFDNARSGIAVDNATGQSSGNVIRRNTVYGNNQVFYMGAGKPLYDQAAIFTDGPDTEIYDNYVYDNAANGIMVNGAWATDAILRDNVIGRDASNNELGNGWNGIFVHTGNGVLIEGNTC